jgi:hypothetical protein
MNAGIELFTIGNQSSKILRTRHVLSMVVLAYNLSIQEAEVEGLRVQSAWAT